MVVVAASRESCFKGTVPLVVTAEGATGAAAACVAADEGTFLSTVAVFSASAASGDKSDSSVSDRSASNLWNNGFGGDRRDI